MKKIKKVAVYINSDKDESGVYTKKVLDVLSGGGADISVLKAHGTPEIDINISKYFDNIDDLLSDVEAFVVLGGDGTILDICGDAARHGVPVLGINFGHLGFLTSFEKEDLENARCIFTGEYHIEERMMADVHVEDGDLTRDFIALNEAAVFSGEYSRIASFFIKCDGRHAIDARADGMIVATPTGSTAYSLSAGGPVIDPQTELFCVTPISPHELGSRPIVFSGTSVLQMHGRTGGAKRSGITVTVDGRNPTYISENALVTVKKSDHVMKMIKSGPDRFFDILNNKFYNR